MSHIVFDSKLFQIFIDEYDIYYPFQDYAKFESGNCDMLYKQFERKLDLENSKHSNTGIDSLIRTHWCNLVNHEQLCC